ncbi:DEAD/DEAH box helicase [Bacillus sp. V5-8f]|uniref:DEAD/DEAH box helicase n=1 Tax=Bacillus sp. V5-8f TaxID=2053044 RepID=UPI000C75FEEB|nr:DEAD/DEAH box helicase [Bacillus sp. V5-8f]PLT35829.1 ATP-dependent helicase [Bacillus sp. V5-8f]
MINKGYLKVYTTALEDGTYAIAVSDEQNRYLHPQSVHKQLFTWDKASYYGTRLDIDTVDGVPMFILDAWGLLNLFATEGFNSFIEWDWSELSSLCLSAAPVLYETIIDGMPVPDFESLQQGKVAWRIPSEVEDEFSPSFWDERIEQTSPIQEEEQIQVREFINSWYNNAASVFLETYSPMKEKWQRALGALKETRLSPDELQAFFDRDSWLAWLGVSEDAKPFTIGLKLQEPFNGEGPWKLNVILRSKKDESEVVSLPDKKLPRGWKKFSGEIDEMVQRWLTVVPWLEENNSFKQELSEFEAWEFLTEASEKLMFLGAEILLPSWWLALRESSLKIKARVKSQSTRGPSFVGMQALMDFDWRFSLNGEDLSEAEFQQLVEDKRRLVYIRGQWVKLDPSLIKQIQELMEEANKKGLQLNDLLHQEFLSEVDEDDEDEGAEMLKIQFELNRDLRKMIGRLRETRNIPILETPEALHGELRPYQSLGMSWLSFLRENGFGACLADDMGLGKTVQIIAYLLHIKEEQELDGGEIGFAENQNAQEAHTVIVEEEEDGSDQLPNEEDTGEESIAGGYLAHPFVPASLIVCPTSVLGNWQRELERFAPDLKVHLHYGSSRAKGETFIRKASGCDVVLTSYGLTHQDFDDLASVRWNSIILDEAQNIKNAQTKQSRAVRKLKGRHHVALSGTPMENRLSELWAIFDFINKGYLGTLGQFQEKYVASIEREEQKGKIKELQSLIQPFLLRRTKRDKEVALNLPDKQEQKEFVPLTSEQASLYEQLIQDTFADIEQLSAFERKGIILQMLGKLKQLCNHPALYLKEEVPDIMDAPKRSGKLEKLAELVDAVQEQDESCLIFTQYIGMGNMMKELLEKRYGFVVPFLNGSSGKKQRDDMIEGFQNGEFPIFILSLKAGGTGLNLTAANHVIHFDRWWNPAVENQATDRAYRIGQKRFVHVHKLICTGTLEEKIDAMLDKKQALNDEIISSDNWITELSTNEIKELVALH